mmetsp:Transcript_37579/g.90634  ORF Transcript_37579/g.90634 Transcript_37579/m.90634 type:complete len:395 (-) Transcript_37579:539-1723(-)
MRYASLTAYKIALKEQLKKERQERCVSDERICESAIRVKLENKFKWQNPHDGLMDKKARAVKSFLDKMDPLRQYIVVPRGKIMKDEDDMPYKLLVVRRGYSRTANTTNVLKKAIPPTENDGNASIAVAKSLPIDTLHLLFANAVSVENELLIGVALDAYTQHLIWEVSNDLDGRVNVHHMGGINAVFPTLVAVTLSSTLKQAGGASSSGRKALSMLVARLECVAHSKDLNPGPLPFSLRRAVRQALLKMVKNLKKEWAEFISAEDERKEVQIIEKKVLDHLKETYGLVMRKRSASHWRKCLLFVCSYRIREGEGSGFCGPTIRLCEMETLEYTRKSRAIAPSKTITTEDDCRVMRQQADEQKEMAIQLLNAIKDTRDIHHYRVVDINLFHCIVS